MEKNSHKILVVDDEPDILEFIEYNLKKEGFEVATASDGKEGIKKALDFLPDLVILDVMMPVMDGIETCRKMREMNEFKQTFIVFLTARSEEYSEVAGFGAGADDYIAKPVRLEDLRTVVSRWMTDRPLGATESPSAVPTREGTAEDCLDAAVLDELRDLSEGETDALLAQMVTHFVEETPEWLLLLRASLEERDWRTVRRIAHDLVGSSGNLGAHRLSRLADDMQARSQVGDVSGAAALLVHLEQEFVQVRGRLITQPMFGSSVRGSRAGTSGT